MYDDLVNRLHRYSENCVAYKLDADFASAVQEAADAIEELTDRNVWKWIPVTERLPERNYNCLVADDGTIVYGYMNFIGEWMDCFGDKLKYVSHWMPLPQPPEKESEP